MEGTRYPVPESDSGGKSLTQCKKGHKSSEQVTMSVQGTEKGD